MELRVRLRHPQLEQHLAELDRGGAGVSDDARARPQRQRRHRDQVFRRRAGSVDLHCPTLLRLKHFSEKTFPRKKHFLHFETLVFCHIYQILSSSVLLLRKPNVCELCILFLRR